MARLKQCVDDIEGRVDAKNAAVLAEMTGRAEAWLVDMRKKAARTYAALHETMNNTVT